MKLSKHRHREASLLGVLPMTSMIDVVFLLLIFFMVTASFSSDEDKLSSALATEGGGKAGALQPQVVRIRFADGATVYEIGAHRLRSINSLRNLLSALPKEQGVVFRVSDGVPIDDAASALQAAVDAGFVKRSYVPSSEP
ncbi:MAG: biopolymer transporter ExbD [Phycisphaeraceae bacterium]|nr:MAG: biopolymer transporter ExbD [Phycisphaeraceae bacterium]